MATVDGEAGHDKCGAAKRAGGECARPAGWGTPHVGVGRCKLHGGSTPPHVVAGERALARIEGKRLAIGFERDEEPSEVLLRELRASRALAAFFEDQMAADGPDGLGRIARLGVTDEKGVPHLTVEAELWQRERDRAVSIAQACIKLGLEERRVRIAEQTGEILAGVLGRVLKALDVFDDPRAPDIVRRELQVLEGTGRLAA